MNLDELHDKAKGAIWGAFVGDAAGARLEFIGRLPTNVEVANAMRMLGGGCWRTAPGQITDDGEMTIALARALMSSPRFDINRIAQYYRQWFLSDPFDVGNATRAALGRGDLDDKDLSRICKANALAFNLQSKANGCLMRATPLGVWGCQVDELTLINAALQDCQLTHPNECCQAATAVYVIAIRHLLLHPSDADGAFAASEAAAQRLDNCKRRSGAVLNLDFEVV